MAMAALSPDAEHAGTGVMVAGKLVVMAEDKVVKAVQSLDDGMACHMMAMHQSLDNSSLGTERCLIPSLKPSLQVLNGSEGVASSDGAQQDHPPT